MLATLIVQIPDTLAILAILLSLPLGLAFGLDRAQRLLRSVREDDPSTRPLPGVFKVARDGRSYVQVGRRCLFGRRGESHASIVSRYNLSL